MHASLLILSMGKGASITQTACASLLVVATESGLVLLDGQVLLLVEGFVVLEVSSVAAHAAIGGGVIFRVTTTLSV